ncbi:MAG: hydrogenase maturation nickel metallochaperone HypA [Lachnospiraceae bacterium]|nr:hydrogenase maturation nickel metallochaperone HypA [Lachnospiraceae bacterium]
MHELGVVFHIIDDVTEVGRENDLASVESVTLQLGTVSAVIPELLTNCWDWAVKKTDLLKTAQLVIEPIEAVTFCEDCKKTYDTIAHGKICPHCGSAHTYLLQGNEFLIKEIAGTPNA